MKSILYLIAVTLLPTFCSVRAQAEAAASPMDIKFNRQAVRRFVFDHDQVSWSGDSLQPNRVD
jgi:hypothetical protein